MKKMIWIGLVFMLLLGACTPAAEEPQTEAEEQEAVEFPAEEAVSEDVGGPKVGGTIIIAVLGDPDSLDPVLAVGGTSSSVNQFVGASLVMLDPDTGEVSPYLAQSWETAEDGMYWDFKLREDILFHNGTPCTAHDFVYTIKRALDPENVSPTLGTMLQNVASAEAIDDYTLRFNMLLPSAVFLETLANPPFLQPISEAYMEEVGPDMFARHPVGVGPYRFKEWETGEKIVLERNPDFVWGPAYSHGGPAYIETIEFRIIPEYSTILAGLEAGELDYAFVESKDMRRIQELGTFNYLQMPAKGSFHSIIFNVNKPPFDDVRVRKAFNLALDRKLLIEVLEHGLGEVMYGPISSSVSGFWTGVEEIGYSYNLEQAQVLMEEAGYILNQDGLFEKDGQPIQLEINIYPSIAQLATVIQEQLKQFGVAVEIVQTDSIVLRQLLVAGDYTMTIRGYGWVEGSGLMFAMFHSSMIGILNLSQVTDPELDKYLETAQYALTLEESRQALAAAQQYVVEQALTAPLYAPMTNFVLNQRIHDLKKSPNTWDNIFDAYIDEN